MDAGKFKLGKGQDRERAQFAGWVTGESLNITTGTLLNADYDLYVSINPVSADAYVYITTDGTPVGQGKLVTGEISTIVRKGMYLGASAEINVTPHGDA